MKTHLALYLQAQNADASHTQDLAKLAWLRRPRLCISIGELFAFALWRGLRHGYVSPSPCSSRSLCDRDTLPFNLLMRNFKRNSACYEQPRRNFDRIELRRRSRRKDKNSKRDRRNAPQSEARREPARSAPEGPARGCAGSDFAKFCVCVASAHQIGHLEHLDRPTLMPEDSVCL